MTGSTHRTGQTLRTLRIVLPTPVGAPCPDATTRWNVKSTLHIRTFNLACQFGQPADRMGPDTVQAIVKHSPRRL
jgi:hypothetical protein